MLVKEFMTTNPVTISPETPIDDALFLMRKRKVKRLPILEKGKLVGIITEADLREAFPSTATTLSVWESNYLISKITVNSFAVKNVVTTTPDSTVEKAALLMRQNNISGLPVLDGDELVGIITGADILDSFIDIMGYKYPGERIVLQVEDKAGVLADIATIAKEAGANITSLAMFHKVPGFAQLVMRLDTKSFDSVTTKLKDKGFSVSH